MGRYKISFLMILYLIGLQGLVEPLFDCCRMVSLLAVSDREFTVACSLLYNLKQIEEGMYTDSKEKVFLGVLCPCIKNSEA